MLGELTQMGFTKKASVKFDPKPLKRRNTKESFKDTFQNNYIKKSVSTPKPNTDDPAAILRRKESPTGSIHIPGITRKKKKKPGSLPKALPDSLKNIKLKFDNFKDSRTGKFLQGIADKKFTIPLNKDKKTSFTFGELGSAKHSDLLPDDIKLEKQLSGALDGEKSYPKYGITFTKKF